MDAADEQSLHALSAAIAGALRSPWEPRCVARAFVLCHAPAAIVLTMQAWIDLDALRSELLQGGVPETFADLRAAAAVFGLDVEALTPEEGADVARAMQRACMEAFALSLPMQAPGAEGATEPDGFGAWLPLYACLVTQCGLSLAEARSCPVGEAYALTAALRRNQGWTVAGEAYALRDVGVQPSGCPPQAEACTPAGGLA